MMLYIVLLAALAQANALRFDTSKMTPEQIQALTAKYEPMMGQISEHQGKIESVVDQVKQNDFLQQQLQQQQELIKKYASADTLKQFSNFNLDDIQKVAGQRFGDISKFANTENFNLDDIQKVAGQRFGDISKFANIENFNLDDIQKVAGQRFGGLSKLANTENFNLDNIQKVAGQRFGGLSKLANTESLPGFNKVKSFSKFWGQ